MRLLPALLLFLLAVLPASAGAAERISVGPGGEQADAPSAADAARGAVLSSDGRVAVFTSAATNLVPGDANGRSDVFLRDRARHTVIRVSRNGGIEPSISGSGTLVLYATVGAGRRRALHVYSRRTGRTSTLRVRRRGVRARDLRILSGTLSPDGRYVAVVAGARDIGQDVRDVALTILDRRTGRERRVLSRPFNDINGVSVSAGGRRVALSTSARLVRGDRNRVGDVYVVETRTRRRFRASRSTGGTGARRYSYGPQLSADGAHVAFVSAADNLVARDTNRADDVFVHDLRRGSTRRVSVGPGGRQLAAFSTAPAISRDGTRVAFQVSPDSVIADGEGPIGDVYVRDRRARRTLVLAAGRSGFPSIAAGARLVAFASANPSLVPGDTNGVTDVFADRF